MSRTHRKSFATDWYSNFESYVRKERGYWRYGIYRNREPNRAEYDKYFRDGKYSESGRKRGYREDTNKLIRNDARQKIVKALRDIEFVENISFATKYDGKHIAWSYW